MATIGTTTSDELREIILTRIEDGRFVGGWDIELSSWLGMLDQWRRARATADAADLDEARRLLSSHWRDIGIVQDLRQRMMLKLWRLRKNTTGRVVHWTGGGQAIPCALFGLFIAVAFTLVAAVIWFCWLASSAPGTGIVFMREDEIAPLLLSAMLGAIAGQFFRINEFGRLRIYHPLLVLLNSLLKPLITMILAVAVVALLKVGLIKIGSVDLAKGDDLAKYAIWFVGFLCGWSERFAPDLIRRGESALAAPTRSSAAS